MTRAKYDALTRDWDRNGYATDCQGLLDAWLTYEQDDRTDINADMDYRLWCTDKGKLSEIDRPYVIGEALFMANSAGKMTHIGWVCGFTADGTPLVVEARGIAYGVVVTRLDGRAWTHRGLMTNMFRYQGEKELIKFEVTKPMQSGVPFAKMQEALNYAGYTDADGNVLEVDGKWGRRSQEAFDKLVADYAPEVVPQPDPEAVFIATDGRSASSIGATRDDIINLMINYGAVTAGMLDGGSSTMMYYANYIKKFNIDESSLDEYQRLGLVNKYKAFTKPRYLPTFFMVEG
ncbi:MAG: phosphodiester glycosidase family protein [Ruminococcus sp.]|nr:phosphodiester glycosidase family protein [Ruminococcus sp.]